jgi:hypothetical protein
MSLSRRWLRLVDYDWFTMQFSVAEMYRPLERSYRIHLQNLGVIRASEKSILLAEINLNSKNRTSTFLRNVDKSVSRLHGYNSETYYLKIRKMHI